MWLTETACPNNGGPLSNQITYMRGALSVMDAMPSVERCAASRPGALLCQSASWVSGHALEKRASEQYWGRICTLEHCWDGLREPFRVSLT